MAPPFSYRRNQYLLATSLLAHLLIMKTLLIRRDLLIKHAVHHHKCMHANNHRHLLHGLLSPRTATLDLTANIGCSECFRFRYVTNVNHCIVPKALIVPKSKSMRSRLDNGKDVRRKHSLQPIAAPLWAVRYCVNYNVGSPCSRCLCNNSSTTNRYQFILNCVFST